MGMIKGNHVYLTIKTQSGVDEFNHPVFDEREVLVGNVLIEPLSSEAVISELSLSGKKASYQLHIPKEDNHVWKDTRVRFYNASWKTIGEPIVYQEENTPLEWNKKIKVEKYE